jgi:hypothetical protein
LCVSLSLSLFLSLILIPPPPPQPSFKTLPRFHLLVLSLCLSLCLSLTTSAHPAFAYIWSTSPFSPTRCPVRRLVRGPFAWLGHGWKGCSKDYPFPPEFNLDYGVPVDKVCPPPPTRWICRTIIC